MLEAQTEEEIVGKNVKGHYYNKDSFGKLCRRYENNTSRLFFCLLLAFVNLS